MKFRKLKITNFKCYSSYECEFSDGLNLFYGPNESGKTTLYQAMVLSLFGPHPSNRKHFKNLNRDDFTKLGGSSKPILELDFTHDGLNYRIKRDFAESKVLIAESENGAFGEYEKFNITQARDFISEMFGGVEEEIFTKYASINHVDLASLDSESYKKENEEMGRSLIRLVESRSGADILDVKKLLDREIKGTGSELVSIDYQIERLSADITAVKGREDELASLKSRESEVLLAIENSRKTRDELDYVVKGMTDRRDASNEIQKLRARIEQAESDYSRYRKMKSSIEKLEDEIKKFPGAIRDDRDNVFMQFQDSREKLTGLKAQHNQLKAQVDNSAGNLKNEEIRIEKEYGNLKNGMEDVQQFKEKDNELKGVETQISEYEFKIKLMKEQLADSYKRKRQLNVAGLATSAIGLIVIFTLLATMENKIVAFVTPFLLFGIVAAVVFVLAKRAVSASKLDDLEKINESHRKLREKSANLLSIKTQLSNKLGLKSRDELDDKYNDFRASQARLAALANIYDQRQKELAEVNQEVMVLEENQRELLNLTGYHTVSDLEVAFKDFDSLQQLKKNKFSDFETGNVETEMEELEKKIGSDKMELLLREKEFDQKFITEPLGEDEFHSRKKQLEDVNEKLNLLVKDQANLSYQISYVSETLHGSYEISEEELDRLTFARDSLSKKKEELGYLKGKIDELSSSYESEFLPELEKRAKELFKQFAGTSNKDFTLQSWPQILISSSELDGFGERHLSQGTRDQLYFALRIAWSDLLSPDGLKLPLIWDDPFVYWDNERTSGACEIATKLVELGHQLFIFTHRRELSDQFTESFHSLEIKKFTL